MFRNDYRWKPRNRRWRRLRFREAARRWKTGRNMRRLRSVLSAVLCLELAVGGRQLWAHGAPDIRFFRLEESFSVEWVEPGPGPETGGPEDGDQEVYGIRFLTDSLELQFYHRRRQIVPSESGFGDH